MSGRGTRIPDTSRLAVQTRDLWRCFRCASPMVRGEWHHRRSRSVVDEHQHEPCNGLNLCGACHRWVHSHPTMARKYGWIVSRYAIPCQVPVVTPGGLWVVLDHDGGMTPHE